MSKRIASLLRPFFLIVGVSTLAVAVNATMAPAAQAQQAPQAQEEQAPVPVQDYDVFVDLPTAFAYIKLPAGWKFIGKLDAAQLRHLPPGTLTALLQTQDDDRAARMAAAGHSASLRLAASRGAMLK